ncbi:MAG TPA: hypothetical protein VHN16_03285 [Streptosporangiaceae bacterium]|nr:hypothetical protein [Streptosporangiaceae bacterium]
MRTRPGNHADRHARRFVRVRSRPALPTGTSLRTWRRRVAGLVAALEAGSRFQAGARVGELGLAR